MIFPLLETIGKKKFNYNEKRKTNWCRNLEISYCMICIVRLYCGEQWQRQGAGLGIRRAQGRWARQQARTGALGHRRACWGAGPCSGRWGVRQSAGRAGVARTGALQAGGREGERQARGAQASGRRTGAGGGARAGERQLGAGPGGRQGAGRAAGRRWAHAARAAWALGLALGSALGPFSIRFDSFFFLSHQMNIVHCKIKFFRKKNNIY